ncbi:MAG TPA: glycosyltransferase family 2 protein, partial [Acidimicrobiales bacterium]
MKVVGLYVVRNEVDVIETNLRHHLATVLDEAIVLDNGSTDGTLQIVARLAEELPIQVASEVGPIYQSDRTTRLARYAVWQGADWVLPIDADEFWVAAAGEGASFRDVLAETPADVQALVVEVVTMVQQRDVLVARPGCLESMTMRPADTIGTPEDAPSLVGSGEISFLESEYTPKCVRRATPDIVISWGNHLTDEVGNATPTDRITCLHAPLRARSVLAAKLDYGRRLLATPISGGGSWQMLRWWQMARAGTMEREWEALSCADGALTVSGRRHELVADERLRAAALAVAPRVRTTVADIVDPPSEMEPAVGAYMRGMDTVPGRLDPLDLRILVEFDRIQAGRSIEGDLFEIGAYYGKFAILLGYLTRGPHERVTVCDVFEHADLIDAESWPVHNHLYRDLTQAAFVVEYLRFHERLPETIVGLSEAIDAKSRAQTCRLVHVDGGHGYDTVRHDAATAERLLRPGGMVVFNDFAAAPHPGVSLAVWELVLGRGFTPVCITGDKLYGFWDAGGVEWTAALDEWVAREPDVGSELHT